MKRRAFILGMGGVAVAAPFVADAQHKPPLIGFLDVQSQEEAELGSFHAGLAEMGYVEGQNVNIEYRWAEDHNERLPALALELANLRPDVIVSVPSGPAARAVKGATSTIPVVFSVGVDPVAQGLVASLAHPGGNLTGVTNFAVSLQPKRLDLLCTLVPLATTIAYLINPTSPISPESVEAIGEPTRTLARARGIKLVLVKAGTSEGIDAAFSSVRNSGAGALLVASDPLFFSRRSELAASAAQHLIPAIYDLRPYVESGGLISYGFRFADYFTDVGIYTGKILKGARPADLPVIQPTRFELLINLKAAKALGLAIPQILLTQADEIIE